MHVYLFAADFVYSYNEREQVVGLARQIVMHLF
jgi:hypothetical protein